MSSRASHEAMSDLHAMVAAELARRIASGEASSADLSVARQFLKDNGVDAMPTAAPIHSLSKALPSYEAEEYDGRRAASDG